MWKQPLAGGQAPDYGPSRAPAEVHRWCACGVRVVRGVVCGGRLRCVVCVAYVSVQHFIRPYRGGTV